MKNLILADLKVLGHRIWTIPLGVFLFIFSFSFIPYLNQVQQFQNWIFAILIPGLLTFELFREEQKNGTGSILMTMPVSKEKYVWAKYILILGFVAINLLIGIVSIEVIEMLKGEQVMEWGVYSFGYDPLNATQWVFIALMTIVPVYFFTRKLKFSIFAGMSVYFTVLYTFFYILSTYFTFYPFTDHIHNYLINLSVPIFIAAMFHISFNFQKGKKYNKYLNSLWFGVILYLSTTVVSYLSNFTYDIFRYFRFSVRFESIKMVLSDEKIERYSEWLASYRLEFIVMSLLAVVLLTTLVIIQRKTKDRFYQNCIMFLFLPIFATILNQFLYNLTFMNFIYDFTSSSNLTILESLALRKMTMIPGMFMMLYFSARSSIYLLKNNRTLK